MGSLDFRSDTVTQPTEEMREAIARAEVGDDVFGEDPTVNELEAGAADRLGKEAGLFVVSGTMGNLLAILTHAGRGDEAMVGVDAHVFLWEAGSMSVVGGITPLPLPTDSQGRLDPAQVEACVRPDDPHLARSRLVLLENSYAAHNGYPLPPGYFETMAAVAGRHGLAIHLDGARLFNAVAALEVEPRELTRHVDSVSFCLSKGLSAPVGSVLCGTRAFIDSARRTRKLLGGGMRQAGVLAAAGLLALDRMTARLTEDHVQARRLADGLARIPGVELDPGTVQTNMIFFDLAAEIPLTPDEVVDRLRREFGIKVGAEGGPRTLRVLTHRHIDAAAVDSLVEALGTILR